MLGDHGRATVKMREGLAWARASAHPFTLAFACHYATAFHQARREFHAVQELADAAIAHSTEHGFELFRSLGAVHRGWLLAEGGRGEEGVAEMQSGLAAYREHGAGFGVPTFLGILAEAYQELGRAKDAMQAIAEALALAEHTGSHYWDAELRRLEGTLALQFHTHGSGTSSAHRRAEACFQKAIEIAKHQQARTLELRAATSLSRLWHSQARRGEAHALLSEVFGKFTEGFDTADLVDAKALLEETAA